MKRLAFLDGIRGWGAFIVVLYHVFASVQPVDLEFRDFSRFFFLNGGLAIDMFFLVSGFSLSIGFAKNRDRMALLKLAYGRYLRLTIPVLFFSLMVFFTKEWGIIPSLNERPDSFKWLLNIPLTFNGTVLFSTIFIYLGSEVGAWNPPLWTIYVEMLGSLLVFAICFFFGNYRLRLCFCLVALVASMNCPHANGQYYACFLAGIVFADLYTQGLIPRRLGFPMLLIGIVGTTLRDIPLLYVSVALFYGIISCAPVRNFFECPVSKFLGRVSFTLYLIHIPVMFMFACRLFLHVDRAAPYAKLTVFLIDVATIAMAIAMARIFVGVDEFAVRCSRKFSQLILDLHTKQTQEKLFNYLVRGLTLKNFVAFVVICTVTIFPRVYHTLQSENERKALFLEKTTNITFDILTPPAVSEEWFKLGGFWSPECDSRSGKQFVWAEGPRGMVIFISARDQRVSLTFSLSNPIAGQTISVLANGDAVKTYENMPAVPFLEVSAKETIEFDARKGLNEITFTSSMWNKSGAILNEQETRQLAFALTDFHLRSTLPLVLP